MGKIKISEGEIYSIFDLPISNFILEKEGQEYDACRFELDGFKIIYRKAKKTPKKVGQFVTFWKRNKEGITEPFHEKDAFNFYFVPIKSEKNRGVFVLPKSILIQKGIVATKSKEGKRGFRIYSPWDNTTSIQANKTQKWQTSYFLKEDQYSNLKELLALFEKPET